MKFEYKIQRQAKSSIEANTYILYESPLYRIKDRCTKIPLFLTLIGLIYALFANNYSTFFHSLKIVSIEAIVFCVFIFLIKYRNKKSTKIHKSKFIDADCISTITIEDGIFTKENEFNFVQTPLSKVQNIDLLSNEIVIHFDSNINLFIPKDSLPASVDEFIEIFKKENDSLKVTDYVSKIKKRKTNYRIAMSCIVVLSILASFFIGRYGINSKVNYNSLITQDELQSENNGNSYHYKNETLGINIYFPKSWNGHYGINENGNDIEVYYLGKKKICTESTLIFKIKNSIYRDTNSNFMGSLEIQGKPYYLYGAKKGTKFLGTKEEYKEYESMFRHVSNLSIN